MNATQALNRLLTGNKRFASGQVEQPHQSVGHRKALNDGQHPFAVIISCSDSRVCPEIIFDCGLGDLFVVRSAGQVGDEAELASVEYAVQHLGVELVMIMGHSNCGAVGVAVAGKEVKGRLAKLVSAIQPALQRSQTTNIDQCARENVNMQVEQLRQDEQIIKPLIYQGHLKIVGSFYDLATGQVELLE